MKCQETLDLTVTFYSTKHMNIANVKSRIALLTTPHSTHGTSSRNQASYKEILNIQGKIRVLSYKLTFRRTIIV